MKLGQRVEILVNLEENQPKDLLTRGRYGTLFRQDGAYHYVEVDGFKYGVNGYSGHEFYDDEIRPSSASLIIKPQASSALEDVVSIEDMIVYIARVSNPSSQQEGDDPKRLINYLTRNKHWSPFEMVNFTLEINTTRDIARQILRHRSFSFQEFSQRYADINALSSNMVQRETRLQDKKNRQSSIDIDDSNSELDLQFYEDQENIWHESLKAYNRAIDMGIAKEQARAFLPEGLTPSRMYMNGTLRSWIHYINLRSGNGTQKEHRLVALDCADVIANSGFSAISEFITRD